MMPRAAVRLGASSLAMVILAACATGPTVGEGLSDPTEPRSSLRPGWAHYQSRHGTYSIGLPPGWSVNAEYCDQDPATVECELKGPGDEGASIAEDTFDHWADAEINSVDEWVEVNRQIWEDQGVPAETSQERVSLPGGPAVLMTVKLLSDVEDDPTSLSFVSYVFEVPDRRVVVLSFASSLPFTSSDDPHWITQAMWAQMAATMNPRGLELP